MNKKRVCSECKLFTNEDPFGSGWCEFHQKEVFCDNVACKDGIEKDITNKEFALSNLGKEVKFVFRGETKVCMIVGYKHIEHPEVFSIIVSLTDGFGWYSDSLGDNDCVLINSPLNVSFWYIGWRDILMK